MDLQRELEEKTRLIEALQQKLSEQQQQAQCQAPLQLPPPRPHGQRQQDASYKKEHVAFDFTEARTSETAVSEEVQVSDFQLFSITVGKALSKGHQEIEREIRLFLQEKLQAVLAGDVVESHFTPFEFRTSRTDVHEIERIVIELRMEGGESADTLRVSYKSRCGVMLPAKVNGQPLEPAKHEHFVKASELPEEMPPAVPPSLPFVPGVPSASSAWMRPPSASTIPAFSQPETVASSPAGIVCSAVRGAVVGAVADAGTAGQGTFRLEATSSEVAEAAALRQLLVSAEATLRERDEELQVLQRAATSGITGRLGADRLREELRLLDETRASLQERSIVDQERRRDLEVGVQERTNRVAELEYLVAKAPAPSQVSGTGAGVNSSTAVKETSSSTGSTGVSSTSWRSRAAALEEELKLKSELVMRLHQRELWFEQQLRRQVEVNGSPLQELLSETKQLQGAVHLQLERAARRAKEQELLRKAKAEEAARQAKAEEEEAIRRAKVDQMLQRAKASMQAQILNQQQQLPRGAAVVVTNGSVQPDQARPIDSFDVIDTNHDGVITREEFNACAARQAPPFLAPPSCASGNEYGYVVAHGVAEPSAIPVAPLRRPSTGSSSVAPSIGISGLAAQTRSHSAMANLASWGQGGVPQHLN